MRSRKVQKRTSDALVIVDRLTGNSAEMETTLSLDQFPSPQELWARYRDWKGLTPDAEKIVLQEGVVAVTS